ncbi:MAG: 3-hydroxyacyl-CoA dehydrogenase family protein [Desulfomonilaceae bacterium]
MMNIEKIAVLGAGTMGHGIAQAAAVSGFTVSLYDIADDVLAAAVAKISNNVQTHLAAKGKISEQAARDAVARVRPTSDLERAVADVDFVIEAVPEKLDLKKDIMARVDSASPPYAILASNTSVLPVTAIASATTRPEKCIGTHFFNPAAVMKLVEVVLPIGVSDETVTTTIELCRRMNKVPVKVKDIPGFIVNRLLGLLYQEAAQMVLEGAAAPDEIDTAMRLGAGHPMGPCELADFGGFDVIVMAGDGIFDYTHQERDRVNILYRKMLEAGRLGRKNGKGFYDYLPDGSKKPFKLF